MRRDDEEDVGAGSQEVAAEWAFGGEATTVTVHQNTGAAAS